MIQILNIERKHFLINGVYQLVNIVNNKSYIGSCAAKDKIYTRLVHHRNDLTFNRHINSHLQNSVNKYGINNLYVVILEVCEKEKCIEKEQYYINLYKPEYNFCKIAGSSLGRSPSKETRKKISEANKKWYKEHPEFLEKILNRKQHIYSDDERKQRSEIRKGFLHSEETKDKIRISNCRKVKNKDTNEIYNSVGEAALKLGYSQATISFCCIGKRKTLNIEYYEEKN